MKDWEKTIAERELQEKRRKAPGWLDSESKILEPARAAEKREADNSLMDQPEAEVDNAKVGEQRRARDDIGEAMDRAFG